MTLKEGWPKLLRLIDDSDEAWREYGRTDPYFGVLTDDKFRRNNLTPARLDEFFESGEHHIEKVLTVLHENVTPLVRMGDALDFGCGVGRLILPLASRFESVVGVDISEAYLSEARQNCENRGITNVQLLETLDPLVRTERRFDFVHSSIVFNHIPWGRGKVIISDLFKLLRPGGAMALQVMLRRQAMWFRRLGSWSRRYFLPLNWLMNLAQGRQIFEPLIQGNEYPLQHLLPLLRDLGAGDFHVRLDTTVAGHVFALISCVKKEPDKGDGGSDPKI